MIIFIEYQDKKCFLEVLGEMSKRFEIKVCAYVLMDNHYHLLLQTMNANLSKAMQWLGATYTRRFNLKNGLSGHLFQGRFKSIVVGNEEYLMRLSLYIHRNPLRAKMVERLADYRWSSYSSYAYGRKSPEWLEKKILMRKISGKNIKTKQQAYRRKVQNYSDENKKIWEDVFNGLLYGTEKFIEEIRSKYLSESTDKEKPQQKKIKKARNPEQLLIQASKELKINLEEIRNNKRILAKNKDKRDLLIYFYWDGGRYTNKEIGELFNLGYSSISRRSQIGKKLASKSMSGNFKKLKSLIKI